MWGPQTLCLLVEMNPNKLLAIVSGHHFVQERICAINDASIVENSLCVCVVYIVFCERNCDSIYDLSEKDVAKQRSFRMILHSSTHAFPLRKTPGGDLQSGAPQ